MTFSVKYLEVTSNHDGQRIDNFLLRQCKGVPKSHIYKAIRSGQVRVNKGRVDSSYKLQQGDNIRIPPMRTAEKTVINHKVPVCNFPIVYEDDVMLVIDKPAGVAVHGGSGVSFGVIEQLRRSRPDSKYLELVHRLDKETSGVLMIAKQRKALLALQDMLRNAVGHRYYKAIVVGDWVNDRQHLRQPLLKWLTSSGERRVKVDKLGKQAHTIVTLGQRFGQYSLVRAELKTGRTHQIRVHLASSGYPVLCDDKYGPDHIRENFYKQGFNRMFLHAYELHLPHPISSEPMVFSAKMPDKFLQLIQFLEK